MTNPIMSEDPHRAVARDLGKALRDMLGIDTTLPARMQELLRKLAEAAQKGRVSG